MSAKPKSENVQEKMLRSDLEDDVDIQPQDTRFGKIVGAVTLFLSICFIGFHLYTAAFGAMPGISQKSIHLGFLLAIFYVNAILDSKKTLERVLLTLFGVFGVLSIIYITVQDKTLATRVGFIYTSDIVFGILLLVSLFEACRRKMGNSLIVVTGVFIVYSFSGMFWPGFLNHPGLTLRKFVNLTYLTTDGIFGTPLYASACYVVLFVLLSAIMNVSGLGNYFTELATAAFGRTRGGPAKVSVVASGLFGSISGSPTANVIGTGTFTIPLMKSNGFTPVYAAAVEAAASTGGALMPPIMGSTAFIIAEMLGKPYASLLGAAILPAILYYLAILFAVDINACKNGLVGLEKEELPRFRDLIKKVYRLAPILFLIYFLAVMRLTVTRAGLYTILVTLVFVELDPETRMSLKQWKQIPVTAAKSAVSVGVACGMAGVISAIIMGTGMGFRLSSVLIDIADNSTLLLLLLTMLVSIIMGMGIPTTAAYLILAVLVAPSLISMGVDPTAAHLFIFYFGCISAITPPVALAAYAAAGLADCNPNKAGYAAFRLAICAFILPFMFVYNPVLLLQGRLLDILPALATAIAGTYLLAAGLEGYIFSSKVTWPERMIMVVGALCLISPGLATDAVGVAVFALEFVLNRMRRKNMQPAL